MKAGCNSCSEETSLYIIHRTSRKRLKLASRQDGTTDGLICPRRIINQGSEAKYSRSSLKRAFGGGDSNRVCIHSHKVPTEYKTIEEVSGIPLREDQDQRNDERL